MSDEPVRGAPSIDAFWVVKVENDVRRPLVSPHSLSFFLSFARFLSRMLFRLKRIRRRYTRLGGRFNLRACHPGESMICQWFSWIKDCHFVVRFICKSRELSDFQRRTTFTSDMAQTYNQKKNVYSIDQILGHDKDEGTVKCLSFFYQRNTRKLFEWVNLKHSQNSLCSMLTKINFSIMKLFLLIE